MNKYPEAWCKHWLKIPIIGPCWVWIWPATVQMGTCCKVLSAILVKSAVSKVSHRTTILDPLRLLLVPPAIRDPAQNKRVYLIPSTKTLEGTDENSRYVSLQRRWRKPEFVEVVEFVVGGILVEDAVGMVVVVVSELWPVVVDLVLFCYFSIWIHLYILAIYALVSLAQSEWLNLIPGLHNHVWISKCSQRFIWLITTFITFVCISGVFTINSISLVGFQASSNLLGSSATIMNLGIRKFHTVEVGQRNGCSSRRSFCTTIT